MTIFNGEITRAQIDIEQKEWEEKKEREVAVVTEQGRIQVKGFDLRNFHDLVGPEQSYSYLHTLGEVQIIELTPAKRLLNVAGAFVGRLRQIL